MDNQAHDSDNQLPFSAKQSFQELYARLPHAAARMRLWKVKEVFQLDVHDPLWGVILALDYHLALYEGLPNTIENVSSALSGSLRQALEEFSASKERLQQDAMALGDSFLSALMKALSESVAMGVREPTKDLKASLELLLKYLQDGATRNALLEPIRLDVQKMAADFNADMIASITKAADAAVSRVESAVPAARRQGIHFGMLGIAALVLMTMDLTLAVVNNATWNISANATVASQESRQVEFFAGLDKNTQATLERHNAHLPEDERLKLR